MFLDYRIRPIFYYGHLDVLFSDTEFNLYFNKEVKYIQKYVFILAKVSKKCSDTHIRFECIRTLIIIQKHNT